MKLKVDILSYMNLKVDILSHMKLKVDILSYMNLKVDILSYMNIYVIASCDQMVVEGVYLDLALIFLLFRFSLRILFFLHLARILRLSDFYKRKISCRSESSNISL